ncbi:hypothetical protein fHeYen902_114c [Yersinia phage fHe-Yen9-02]|nr:hypothetical protein fHeYen902_114c [Yersinia phage fHe-Yen9-02]
MFVPNALQAASITLFKEFLSLSYNEFDEAAARIAGDMTDNKSELPELIKQIKCSDSIKYDWLWLRDYRVIGLQLPQRSGNTILSIAMCIEYIKAMKLMMIQGKIAHSVINVTLLASDIDRQTIDSIGESLGEQDVLKHITTYQVRDAATYGRVCGTIAKQVAHKPSLVVVDPANWIIGNDIHMESLIKAMSDPTLRPLQHIVRIS